MFTLDHLLTLSRAYAEYRRVSESTVSKELFGNARKLGWLATGEADVGYNRLQRAVADLARLWPADLAWPAGIDRPAAAPASDEAA